MEKELKKQKKRLFKNIDTLRRTLNGFLENGLLDINSVFYNELEMLEEEIHASKNPLELRELIERGKNFEKQLCVLYDKLGISTSSLDWPDL
jgi:hypothetical protein